MKILNRYEMTGIGASIVIVALALGIARFSSFTRSETSAIPSAADVVMVDASAENKEAALRDAITDASDRDGRVTKLVIYDASVGGGRAVKIGDTATVHYIGLIKDGPQFDNSYTKETPLSFKVGAGEIIEGWERGIIGMKEGGKRILVVPASMGYGNDIVDPIPANATLIFSIELLLIE